jgi:hypothetical protein
MSEPQKDLTGLLELSEELKESGQEPSVPEGLIFEDTPIDQIDQFESLETYAEANPMSEASSEPASTFTEESSATHSPEADPNFPVDTDHPASSLDFLSTPSQQSTSTSEEFASFDTTPTQENPAPEETHPDPVFEPTPEPTSEPTPHSAIDSTEVTQEEITRTEPQVISTPEPPRTPAKVTPQKIPNAVQAAIPAAFPFSLLIEGPLTPREKEKLLDIIQRENLGIREIDLEPQFEAQKILLPRISEFAGVYIIQKLREVRAKIKFGPSDEIFAAQGTTEDTQPLWTPNADAKDKPPQEPETEHPADAIPVTTERSLPGLEPYFAIDTITASGTLQTFAVEAESTGEYQDLLTALQRELKYKARRRGAKGLIHFRIQLNPLTSPSRYRLTVTGLAIK